MIAGNHTCYKSVKGLRVINKVLVSLHKAATIVYVITELVALFDANNFTLGMIKSGMYHLDKSFGFSGAFNANNKFYHSIPLSGEFVCRRPRHLRRDCLYIYYYNLSAISRGLCDIFKNLFKIPFS